MYGNFIFQEVKNYLNTSKSTVDLNKINNGEYIVDRGKGKAQYVFDDSKLVTSYSNAPQYQMIKNDFIVWGVRESATGAKLPIRFHLSIDKKPPIGNLYLCSFYIDEEEVNSNYQSANEIKEIPYIHYTYITKSSPTKMMALSLPGHLET